MISTDRLKAFEFFKGFSDAQLARLVTTAKEEIFEAGVPMYKNGDPARALFMIEEGKAILTMDSYLGPHKPPLQVTVDVITKGESQGWSAVVAPYLYTLGALCIDRVKAIALDALALRKLMDDDPALGYLVMTATAKVISNRLNHTRIILVGERGLAQLTDY
ncbi:MAG: cyclic nucleotide-binding domain-containing protein [Deltaproteobacteria bacterium]|nr:cyclic nucleotide-binding domain-containing protein [Deltaproteobacteria bacterium]